MFSITEVVAFATAAEALLRINFLTEGERCALLKALSSQIVTDIQGIPDHVKLVKRAITREIERIENTLAAGSSRQPAATEKQSRKAKRVEKQAEVAPSGVEEVAEEAEGEAEGVKEQAQNA